MPGLWSSSRQVISDAAKQQTAPMAARRPTGPGPEADNTAPWDGQNKRRSAAILRMGLFLAPFPARSSPPLRHGSDLPSMTAFPFGVPPSPNNNRLSPPCSAHSRCCWPINWSAKSSLRSFTCTSRALSSACCCSSSP